MNRALWSKAVHDVRLLLGATVLLMFVFQALYVWIVSLFDLESAGLILQLVPPIFEKISGLPLSKLATPEGRLAMAYVEPPVLILSTAWGIARGTDVVSGEIGRGTMELLLAQPVRRSAVILVPAVVATSGAALIAAACWLGTCLGVWLFPLGHPVDLFALVPGAVNLFSLMYFLAGVGTLVSACDEQRWRSIGIMAALYVLSLIIKLVAKAKAELDWLLYTTFLASFEPHILIADAERAWELSVRYDGTLLGLGTAAYVVATIVFARRDVPAPV